MSTEILIRLAGPADRDELRSMQAKSFRELGAACYERNVIEAFISAIGTMDDSLLEQGTYYAAVAGGAIVGAQIAGAVAGRRIAVLGDYQDLF